VEDLSCFSSLTSSKSPCYGSGLCQPRSSSRRKSLNLKHLVHPLIEAWVQSTGLGVQPEEQSSVSSVSKFRLGSPNQCPYLAVRSVPDCSTIISLGSLPVSATILRLRSTFRVSLQCHLEATAGSSVCSSLYIARASSGKVEADGGESGSLLNKSLSSGDSFDDRLSDERDGKDGFESFPIRRSGNIKCCIQ
jgi:hypothetical protein